MAAALLLATACAARAQYAEPPPGFLAGQDTYGPLQAYPQTGQDFYGPQGAYPPEVFLPPGPQPLAPPPANFGNPINPALELIPPPAPELSASTPAPSSAVTEILPPPDSVESPMQYGLFDFGYWFPVDGWSNSFEIGINGSEGNAQTFSLRTGAHIQRKFDLSTFTLDVKYAKTITNGAEKQHNLLLNSNVERSLGESRWTTFFKSNLEYDEFKAFNVRTSMYAGMGYHLVKADDAKFLIRFGSGFSREIGGPDDAYVPESLYGLDFDRQLTKRQKLYATMDYFPDWSDYSDYRIVTNAGWEFVLDEIGNLSLKLGAIDRYDSTPHGRQPNDIDYSLVLLWKQ